MSGLSLVVIELLEYPQGSVCLHFQRTVHKVFGVFEYVGKLCGFEQRSVTEYLAVK